MEREPPITAVEMALHRRRRLLWPFTLLVALIFLVGVVAIILGAILLVRYTGSRTPQYAEDLKHFEYGSIGAEPAFSAAIPARSRPRNSG